MWRTNHADMKSDQSRELEGVEVLRSFFQRVWTEQDASAIDELFADTGLARGLGRQPLMGPAEFRPFHASLCRLLTDIKITIEKSTDDGSWTWIMGTMEAKARSSGEKVTMHGAGLARIENGMIQEAYNHWDFTAVWSQLGLLPPDTFEQALQGNKVVFPCSG